MVLLAFLLVLLLFGLGFAVHPFCIAAVVFFILWLVGFAFGRGESAGSHRFVAKYKQLIHYNQMIYFRCRFPRSSISL